MTQHRDLVYLRHMRDHAEEAVDILGAIPRDRLGSERIVQLALLHLVGIVGEAASRVGEETRGQLPGLPWRDIIGMRNRIIHGYSTVDIKMLWDTVADDLPALLQALDDYSNLVQGEDS